MNINRRVIDYLAVPFTVTVSYWQTLSIDSRGADTTGNFGLAKSTLQCIQEKSGNKPVAGHWATDSVFNNVVSGLSVSLLPSSHHWWWQTSHLAPKADKTTRLHQSPVCCLAFVSFPLTAAVVNRLLIDCPLDDELKQQKLPGPSRTFSLCNKFRNTFSLWHVTQLRVLTFQYVFSVVYRWYVGGEGL